MKFLIAILAFFVLIVPASAQATGFDWICDETAGIATTPEATLLVEGHVYSCHTSFPVNHLRQVWYDNSNWPLFQQGVTLLMILEDYQTIRFQVAPTGVGPIIATWTKLDFWWGDDSGDGVSHTQFAGWL